MNNHPPGGDAPGERREDMTDNEAYKILGARVMELTEKEEVQKKMLEILHKESKEAAEKWVYSLAIATLCITPEEFANYAVSR